MSFDPGSFDSTSFDVSPPTPPSAGKLVNIAFEEIAPIHIAFSELTPGVKNPGDTFGLKATFTGEDGSLLDPDSQEIKIYDSSGNLMDTITDPSKVSTGVWKFYWNLPDAGPLGEWKVTWKAVSGTYTEREHFYFEVKQL